MSPVYSVTHVAGLDPNSGAPHKGEGNTTEVAARAIFTCGVDTIDYCPPARTIAS